MASQQQITLPVAAFRLGENYRAVYDLVLAGKLAAERVDGRWMVSTKAVDQLLRERRAAVTDAA